MILTILLEPETKETLEQQAKISGLSVDGYIKLLIAKDLIKDAAENEELTSAVDELLAPVRQEVLEKGLIEREKVADYVKKLLFARQRTIGEIFAPFRKEIEEQGMSDEGLAEIFTQARRDYYKEKKTIAKK